LTGDYEKNRAPQLMVSIEVIASGEKYIGDGDYPYFFMLEMPAWNTDDRPI